MLLSAHMLDSQKQAWIWWINEQQPIIKLAEYQKRLGYSVEEIEQMLCIFRTQETEVLWMLLDEGFTLSCSIVLISVCDWKSQWLWLGVRYHSLLSLPVHRKQSLSCLVNWCCVDSTQHNLYCWLLNLVISCGQTFVQIGPVLLWIFYHYRAVEKDSSVLERHLGGF